ncbi:MAG: phosphatidylserine/phosphatidylglycerophosphate/cardiolipin synthase-like enzyme [Polyangiales bacterium]|jgi:phosphatidylserine/phosphatidylglycerophosphate/cardiolipin synthase-like enzyme
MLKRNIFLIALTLAGACQTQGIDSPDGIDADAIGGGKADELSYADCLLDEVVALVNDNGTSSETLRAAGLHTRAANNIIKARSGADEIEGTSDDVLFADIEAVDDVSYVGPVALRQLTEMVSCDDAPSADVEAIFSPQSFERTHLARAVELINAAEDSVDVAMYSMSNSQVISALGRAAQRGVSVRMIFHPALAERRDPAGTRSASLEDMGIDVRYINKIMHHKYVIVDGPRGDAGNTDGVLMTGSGNWSNSAGSRYDENTVVFHAHAELLLRYEQEFHHLWTHSRDFDAGEGFERFDTDAISNDDIAAVDDEDAAAFFTSANFRTTTSTRYGDGFSVNRGENEVSDQLVLLIQNAERSIRIASGHLRSRPVALALVQAIEDNPALEVQVYTDGQEFLSASSHDRQVDEREDCVEEAGTSETRIADCYDGGFLYGYEFFEAGIDLRFKHYSYRWHYSYAAQMHHKYFIIDDSIIATGSYNLSDNAEHATMENVVILSGERYAGVVQNFVDNFNAMWDAGRDDDMALYNDLMADVESGTSFEIVYDSMALAWDEIDSLKRAMRANCSDLDTEEFRRNPERHHYCRP